MCRLRRPNSARPRQGVPPVRETTFDYESKQWGSAPVSARPWHLQGLRLRYCLEDLASVRGACLDAGCGGGNMVRAIQHARPDLSLTGVDGSVRAIRAASREHSEIRFEVGDVEALPFSPASFDAVVMFDVLEHVERPGLALGEIVRVLKPGGLFHLALPLEVQPGTLLR